MSESSNPRLDLNLAKASFKLPALGTWPEAPHQFREEDIWAINAALASGRPLLVRGEPGTGKSQLARAAAQKLEWPFMSRVVNARFEPEDLLFRFDAVARLAMAQVMPKTEFEKAVEVLKPDKFLLPEVLWWALNHSSAQEQYERAREHCGETSADYAANQGFPKTDENGVVVLIDEIDKADAEVPNSLLECLANNGFQTPFGGQAVTLGAGKPPLVVITTNEERELPAAFLRRCLVLQMDLPEDAAELRRHLRGRAEVHHPDGEIHADVVEEAISQMLKDRQTCREQGLPFPGQAEFLDLLEAVKGVAAGREEQLQALGKIRDFALVKNRA